MYNNWNLFLNLQIEPENWGGNCKNGRKQSPVDLNYGKYVH